MSVFLYHGTKIPTLQKTKNQPSDALQIIYQKAAPESCFVFSRFTCEHGATNLQTRRF